MEVFKYEYDVTPDKTRWKALILADNMQQGLEFLHKVLPGKQINLFSTEYIGKVDGITDAIIDRILNLHRPLEKLGDPVVEKEKETILLFGDPVVEKKEPVLLSEEKIDKPKRAYTKKSMKKQDNSNA